MPAVPPFKHWRHELPKYAVEPTNQERILSEDDIIVSKTDLKGRITYANDIFLKIACYEESEVLGEPHSIVRHPDMPRSVFKLLWDQIESGEEIFAYVKNMAKNGDYYWVFAHVTPSFDSSGNISGYHSNRRAPRRDAIAAIEPLYRDLVAEESRHANAKDGLDAACGMLMKALDTKGVPYDEFVFSL